MKKLCKNNKLLVILIIITGISILTGVIFHASLKEEDKKVIIENVNQLIIQNKDTLTTNLIETNLYTITLGVLGISIIGILLIPILYFLKVFILLFEITSFLHVLTWKKLIYITIYFLPKTLLCILSFYMTYYSMKYSIYLIEYLFLHKNISFKKITKNYMKILGINIIGNIIISLLNYFVIFKLLKINI